MSMIWFIPLGLLVGALGTRTAFQARRDLKTNHKDMGWLLLIALSWLPTICWALSRFITQD
jgi:hypothetical protein